MSRISCATTATVRSCAVRDEPEHLMPTSRATKATPLCSRFLLLFQIKDNSIIRRCECIFQIRFTTVCAPKEEITGADEIKKRLQGEFEFINLTRAIGNSDQMEWKEESC